MDRTKQTMWGLVKQFAEKTGIYIFFISWVLYTQVKWVKRHNGSGEIEIRLLLGFFAGMLLAFGIIKLIQKIADKTNKNYEAFLNKLSVALSPGIFFILASSNKIFRYAGIVFCIFTAVYIWVKPFRDFIKHMIYIEKFKNILIVENNKALINVEGTYEKANPEILQSFLINLTINFNECCDMGIDEIKIDFSNLKEGGKEELKPIIESVAGYFNLKTTY